MVGRSGSTQGRVGERIAPSATRAPSAPFFDILNQALGEFVRGEPVPADFGELVEAAVQNKIMQETAIDPVVYVFADPMYADVLLKFIDYIQVRHLRVLAGAVTSNALDFWRFYRWMAERTHIKILEFVARLGSAASDVEPQKTAALFLNHAFDLFAPLLAKDELMPAVVDVIFAHTENDETSREARLGLIAGAPIDQHRVMARCIMNEKIFSEKLIERYTAVVESGLAEAASQPQAVHILRYLRSVRPAEFTRHLPALEKLLGDSRPQLQTALAQILGETSNVPLLETLVGCVTSRDVLIYVLHVVTELGKVPTSLLMQVFARLGPDSVEAACSERVTVETPIGPLTLARLTNTWNSAAVNQALIGRLRSTPVTQWDVEFALCKVLLRQPMDTASATVWRDLFGSVCGQLGELLRQEESADTIGDIILFYICQTQDFAFFEKLTGAFEAILTVGKEKCKLIVGGILTAVGQLGQRWKQAASQVTPVSV